MLSWKPSLQTLSCIMGHHPTLCWGTIHLSPNQNMWSVNCSHNENIDSITWCCFSWTNSKARSSCLDICLYIAKMWDQMCFASLTKVEFPLSSETHVNIKRRYEVFKLHIKEIILCRTHFQATYLRENPNSWMRDYKALQIDKLWEWRHQLPLGLGYLAEGDSAFRRVSIWL